MILAPTNRRIIRPGDKPSFEHTQRYGLIKGHWSNANRIGLWLFNEGAGKQALDLSGNNKTIALGGTPEWVAGKYGSSAIYFGGDASGDYLTTPPFPTGTYSVVMWLRCEETGTYSYLFDARIGAGVGYIYNTNTTSTIVAGGTCYVNGVQTTSSYQNEWFQLVVSGQALEVPDGIRIARKADLRSDQSQEGPIDHLMLYKGTLTVSEIAELYWNPFAGIERIAAPVYFVVPEIGGADIQRTIDDSVGLTDVESTIKEMYRVFNESVGIGDVYSKVWDSVRIVTESLGIADMLSKEETKVISESLGITDVVSRVSVVLRTLVESLGITDNVSDVWEAIRTFSESLGITDSVSIGDIIRTIDDSLGMVDSVSKVHIALRTLSESLGLADAITSIFVISRIISDSEGITDGLALQRIMTIADTLNITDDVTRLVEYLRVQDDDIGLLDSIVRVSLILRTIDDGMGITDEVSAQLGALLKAVWAFVIMRQSQN